MTNTSTNSHSIRVSLVQLASSPNNPSSLARCIEGIRQASQQGAQLVLLQELHNTHYFCQSEDPDYFDLAESIPGPSTEILGKVALETGLVIVASLFEKRSVGLYHNTAVVIDSDGQIAGKYRKMHIPDDPGYYEKYYFAPGDSDFKPIRTSIGNLGVLICWDQWFPEAARLMTLAGADLLLYPTAIGWEPTDNKEEKLRQQCAWQTVQRSHAICNGLPVLACNRVGFEASHNGRSQGINFWGSSFVCDSFGKPLIEGPDNKECVLVTDININETKKTRNEWPFLRDRRTDAYDELLCLFRDN